MYSQSKMMQCIERKLEELESNYPMQFSTLLSWVFDNQGTVDSTSEAAKTGFYKWLIEQCLVDPSKVTLVLLESVESLIRECWAKEHAGFVAEISNLRAKHGGPTQPE